MLDILDGRTKRSERHQSGVEDRPRDTSEGFSQNSTVLPVKKAEKGECERTNYRVFSEEPGKGTVLVPEMGYEKRETIGSPVLKRTNSDEIVMAK